MGGKSSLPGHPSLQPLRGVGVSLGSCLPLPPQLEGPPDISYNFRMSQNVFFFSFCNLFKSLRMILSSPQAEGKEARGWTGLGACRVGSHG